MSKNASKVITPNLLPDSEAVSAVIVHHHKTFFNPAYVRDFYLPNRFLCAKISTLNVKLKLERDSSTVITGANKNPFKEFAKTFEGVVPFKALTVSVTAYFSC